MKTVLIMAGGTGGHIFPALAVAKALEKIGCKIVWLGSIGAMETKIIPTQNSICLELLPMKGIRGNGIFRKIYSPFMLMKSCYLAYKIIKKHNIKYAVGFGSFITVPGGIVARMKNIPLFLHEQNAILGLSNKILSNVSIKNFYAFPGVFRDNNNDGLVGNPVRRNIEDILDPVIRFKGREGVLKVLVLGGSLGAKIFNDKLPLVFAKISDNKRPIIYHQCGDGNKDKVQKLYNQLNVSANCFDFLSDIERIYSEVDFVICRAGALTIAEISCAGLGGILIPFPFAVDDHQTKNAMYLLKNQAIYFINQKDFTIDLLVEKISNLTREKCLLWAKNSRKLAKVGSAEKMANIIVKY